jgi:hypothetical protein
MAMRCDECGRFTSRLVYVWGPLGESGPDHEACPNCRPDMFDPEGSEGTR